MTESDPDRKPVDPAEHGNYEGVSGGDTTPPSGDPDAEAAQEGGGREPGSRVPGPTDAGGD
jgi:hypothetical protein